MSNKVGDKADDETEDVDDDRPTSKEELVAELQSMSPGSIPALLNKRRGDLGSEDLSHIDHIATLFLSNIMEPNEIQRFSQQEGRSFRDTLATAACRLAVQARKLRMANIWISPCKGCNIIWDLQDIDWQRRPKKKMGSQHGEIPEMLHMVLMHLDVTCAILNCDHLNDQELCDFEQLLLMGTPPAPPPDQNLLTWCQILDRGGKVPPVLATQALLDNCFVRFPHPCQSGVSMMALLCAREPANFFSQVEPQHLCRVLAQYILRLLELLISCISNVDERFLINAFLQVVPIIYYLADWYDAHEGLEDHSLLSGFVATCITSLGRSTENDHNDVPPDFLLFPECFGMSNQVRPLFSDPEFVAEHHMTATIVAILEVCVKLTRNGISVRDHRVILGGTEVSVATAFQKHVEHMEKICKRTPRVQYAQALIEYMADTDNEEKKQAARKAAGSGMLFEGLSTRTRCHLEKCPKRNGLEKCSGCGIAQYCCRQHQKLHWPRHKDFCKQQCKAQTQAKERQKKKAKQRAKEKSG